LPASTAPKPPTRASRGFDARSSRDRQMCSCATQCAVACVADGDRRFASSGCRARRSSRRNRFASGQVSVIAGKVTVVAPEPDGATVTFRRRGEDLIPIGRHDVNPRYLANRSFDPIAPAPQVMAYKHCNPEDYDGYCYGPHHAEVLALLHPACFFHGRESNGVRQLVTFLGREAELVPLLRLIRLTNPRMLGDAYNPSVFATTEEIELIVDRERGVILEWRGLFDGEVYERHFFTELHFDEPVDESIFYPEGRNPEIVRPSFLGPAQLPGRKPDHQSR